jgi:kynureninase
VYLCGNSLGLQPKAAARYLEEELEDWRSAGCRGAFPRPAALEGLPRAIRGASLALAGARLDEVVCMNGLTVNLHLLMVSFYQPTHAASSCSSSTRPFPRTATR